MISLVKDTIDEHDINRLIDWLKTQPRLTKGDVTLEFEKQWSNWLGVKYSIYVNSGSSANLAMVHALNYSKLRNRKIIVPAVSWSTTVAPVIQLGFEPIICEADRNTLSIDLNRLEILCEEYNPSVVIVVNPLGFVGDMDRLLSICERYDLMLLEDSCETIGTTYNRKKAGTFGDMSSFSTFYGHIFSTIEGGIVSTNNEELYNLLLMIRSHGWDRDLNINKQKELRKLHNIDDFNALYTFYVTGFNIRATDLQAKIGLCQLEKLDKMCENRFRNYQIYQSQIENVEWKPNPIHNEFISNFAYPIIHSKKERIVEELIRNEVECRPLICGSMECQPFIKSETKSTINCQWAKYVHDYGMYVPNNDKMTENEVNKVCKIVNEVIKNG